MELTKEQASFVEAAAGERPVVCLEGKLHSGKTTALLHALAECSKVASEFMWVTDNREEFVDRLAPYFMRLLGKKKFMVHSNQWGRAESLSVDNKNIHIVGLTNYEKDRHHMRGLRPQVTFWDGLPTLEVWEMLRKPSPFQRLAYTAYGNSHFRRWARKQSPDILETIELTKARDWWTPHTQMNEG